MRAGYDLSLRVAVHIDIRLNDGLFVLSKCHIRRRNIGEAFFLPVLFNTVPKLPYNLQSYGLMRHRGRCCLVKNSVDQLDTQVIRQGKILFLGVPSSCGNPGIPRHTSRLYIRSLPCILQISGSAGRFPDIFFHFSAFCS